MTDKYELDSLRIRDQSHASFAISWCATAFVAFFCLLLALVSRGMIRPFDALFQGLAVEVPWPTRFLLATYSWLLPMLYLAFAAGAIVVQSSGRDFRTKRLAVVRIFLGAIVSAGVVVFILYLPLLVAVSKLSNTK